MSFNVKCRHCIISCNFKHWDLPLPTQLHAAAVELSVMRFLVGGPLLAGVKALCLFAIFHCPWSILPFVHCGVLTHLCNPLSSIKYHLCSVKKNIYIYITDQKVCLGKLLPTFSNLWTSMGSSKRNFSYISPRPKLFKSFLKRYSVIYVVPFKQLEQDL